MPLLTVTATTGAFFAIMMVLLSVLTSLRRAQLKTSSGDGGDETLRRRIRAHGNFAEYAPLALLLLGLVEALGVAHAKVLALAVAFCLARVLHAVGMLFMSGAALRALAMLLQHAGYVTAAVLLAQKVMNAA